jgi:hypothetical protein
VPPTTSYRHGAKVALVLSGKQKLGGVTTVEARIRGHIDCRDHDEGEIGKVTNQRVNEAACPGQFAGALPEAIVFLSSLLACRMLIQLSATLRARERIPDICAICPAIEVPNRTRKPARASDL